MSKDATWSGQAGAQNGGQQLAHQGFSRPMASVLAQRCYVFSGESKSLATDCDGAQQAIRHGASGGTVFIVEFAIQTGDANHSVPLGRNYDLYRGAYKGWEANVDMPADWRVRVARKELGLLGGLDDSRRLADGRPCRHRPVRRRVGPQCRDYDIQTNRGVSLPSRGDESFHSDTAEGAVSGLRRKGQCAGKGSGTCRHKIGRRCVYHKICKERH